MLSSVHHPASPTSGVVVEIPCINDYFRSDVSTLDDVSHHSNLTAETHLTALTAELREAAKKTIRHAKYTRAIHAAVPMEVKEAMLDESGTTAEVSDEEDEDAKAMIQT